MVVRAAREGEKIGLSIVVPVYNEGENLEELYSGLQDCLRNLDVEWEILFIDDGSTDDTEAILTALQDKVSQVRIVRFPANRGLSAALTAGFRHSRGETIISTDGDLQFEPSEIPILLEGLRSSDVVCGWRKQRRDGFSRRALSFFAYLARRMVLGDRIHDSGCTFRAYRRKCIEGLTLSPGQHRFLPYILWSKGHSITEIPVSHHPRKHGKSKYNLRRVGHGLRMLFALRFKGSGNW